MALPIVVCRARRESKRWRVFDTFIFLANNVIVEGCRRRSTSAIAVLSFAVKGRDRESKWRRVQPFKIGKLFGGRDTSGVRAAERNAGALNNRAASVAIMPEAQVPERADAAAAVEDAAAAAASQVSTMASISGAFFWFSESEVGAASAAGCEIWFVVAASCLFVGKSVTPGQSSRVSPGSTTPETQDA